MAILGDSGPEGVTQEGKLLARMPHGERCSKPSAQGVHRSEATITQMRHFDKICIPYFQMLLTQARHRKVDGNNTAREADDPDHPHQEKLKL